MMHEGTTRPTILVLHGITMNGKSMLRALGPLAGTLEGEGFELVAPDGGRSMSRAEADGFVDSIAGAYERRGLNAREWFADGKYWDGENHFDWLDPFTDDDSGAKTYRAFEASVASVRDATDGLDVRGIIGFSQGCVWGAVVTALARSGELPFGDTLRFGIYMSGFLPVFDEPRKELWPIRRDFASRFVIGDRDPLFPEPEETIGALAERFPEEDREVVVAPGLGHEVTRDPELIRRLGALAGAHR